MIIKNVIVYTEDKKFTAGGIVVHDDKIESIYTTENVPDMLGEEVVDGQGAYAIPGLIDLHFHGCMGDDFCDNSKEAIENIAKYYDYLEKFGLLRKTGIDLPGEAGSIFLKEDKVGPIELATISFGQRFEITPIQMITAVSTIANKGTYVKPRIVKKIINNESGEVREIEPEKTENVISKKTAEDVLSMMESVVEEGTGKNASVQGYSIGGKTGTSEDGVNTGKYVTSFVGVAPISDPEVVILITLYNPTGEGGHQGGGVAAPIGSQVLGEVLPYLEIQKDTEDENMISEEVIVPNITGITISEAKKKLKDAGLDIKYEETEEDISNKKVISQVPNEGMKVNKESKIIVEYEK